MYVLKYKGEKVHINARHDMEHYVRGLNHQIEKYGVAEPFTNRFFVYEGDTLRSAQEKKSNAMKYWRDGCTLVEVKLVK